MDNYFAYSSGIFEANEKQALSLEMDWDFTEENYAYNLAIIKKKYPLVEDFTIRAIPKHMKRSNKDQARLLFCRDKDGRFWGKRFNKSQYFPIRI